MKSGSEEGTKQRDQNQHDSFLSFSISPTAAAAGALEMLMWSEMYFGHKPTKDPCNNRVAVDDDD